MCVCEAVHMLIFPCRCLILVCCASSLLTHCPEKRQYHSKSLLCAAVVASVSHPKAPALPTHSPLSATVHWLGTLEHRCQSRPAVLSIGCLDVRGHRYANHRRLRHFLITVPSHSLSITSSSHFISVRGGFPPAGGILWWLHLRLTCFLLICEYRGPH